jgi:citrate lyase subunit beta / citryl-CoA lyase
MSGTGSAADGVVSARSLLCVPGDRPERFDKAAASGADLVVLDLEDAVAPAAKADALGHVVEWLAGGRTALVRVNGTGTPTHAAEIEALAGTSAAVMLPKTDGVDQIADVRERLGGRGLVALVETARGVRDIDAIAATEGVLRVALGTIDLAAELGIDPSSYAALAHSRSALVVACAAAGLPSPIDGVTVQLDDTERLGADLAHARELGLGAKLCIHPRQVETVNVAFSPSADEVAWARRIVEATTAAGDGVAVVDGAMVDLPVVLRAQRILGRVRD